MPFETDTVAGDTARLGIGLILIGMGVGCLGWFVAQAGGPAHSNLASMTHSDPVAREKAAIKYVQVLLRKDRRITSGDIAPLLTMLKTDTEATVRATAATALGQARSAHALKDLLGALRDPSSIVRVRAAGAIGTISHIEPAAKSLRGSPKDWEKVIKGVTPLLQPLIDEAAEHH
jgi:hypothetical protein